ncbi:MAG: response regulator transcription factor [Ruminococcus sp.]|nr:response regulator transcription factor [Ruminococcus sp.]
MKVLIVEDEPSLNKIMLKKLRADGFSADSCFTGSEALDYIELGNYDIVLLDVMIPAPNGLEVLKTLRDKGNNIPVILLTAMGSTEDRVKGLNYGADDYIAKPFNFQELEARMYAVSRRLSGNTTNKYTVADLVVETDTRKVFRGGKSIELSAKEFAILEYLIRNKGIVLTRDKIEQNAWDFNYEGGSNIVDVYIRYLRQKIDSNSDVKLIHTKRGVGYVLTDNTNNI